MHARTVRPLRARRIVRTVYSRLRSSFDSLHAKQVCIANTVQGMASPMRQARCSGLFYGVRGVVHAAIVFPNLDNQ